MQIDGEVAVVTGATSGIGLATAERLAHAGAYVVLGDINLEKGKEAAQQIINNGGNAEFLSLDVTDHPSIEAFKNSAYEQKKHVDIVANVNTT